MSCNITQNPIPITIAYIIRYIRTLEILLKNKEKSGIQLSKFLSDDHCRNNERFTRKYIGSLLIFFKVNFRRDRPLIKIDKVKFPNGGLILSTLSIQSGAIIFQPENNKDEQEFLEFPLHYEAEKFIVCNCRQRIILKLLAKTVNSKFSKHKQRLLNTKRVKKAQGCNLI